MAFPSYTKTIGRWVVKILESLAIVLTIFSKYINIFKKSSGHHRLIIEKIIRDIEEISIFLEVHFLNLRFRSTTFEQQVRLVTFFRKESGLVNAFPTFPGI